MRDRALSLEHQNRKSGHHCHQHSQMTKGHIAPLDADEDQSLETYCFSFLSRLDQNSNVGDLFSLAPSPPA